MSPSLNLTTFRAGQVRHPVAFVFLFVALGPPLGGCLAALALACAWVGIPQAIGGLPQPAFYGLASLSGYLLGFAPSLATAVVALLVQRRARRITTFEVVALGTLASAILGALPGLSWPTVVVALCGAVTTFCLWLIARPLGIVGPFVGAITPPFS